MVNTSAENLVYQQIGDETYQILNHSCHDDIILNVYGYKRSKLYSFLYHFVSVILIGIPYIICSWYPHCNKVKMKKRSLKYATLVLLTDNHEHSIIVPVHIDILNESGENREIRYFNYQHVKYVWRNDTVQFAALIVPNADLTLNDIIDKSRSLAHAEQQHGLKLYGPNVIRIEVKSYLQLFVQEVFNPFYLFQIFSIVLWSCDEYFIYAGCILFLSLVSIVTSLYKTKKQSRVLHDLVAASNCTHAQVCRPGSNPECESGEPVVVVDIDAAMLVPGDLIVIPANGCIMACDAVLLTGNCIVNESMLTGESVPVTKTPPNHSTECYNVDIHKRHTLFAGTHVIQTRFYGGSKVVARVLRTGFHTTKGELIKSILYPKPTGLQFYKDAIKMVAYLAVIATTGMAYCVYLYIDRHAEIEEICIRALDIITIVVPPALPAAMTVGTIYSQNRLKKLNIFCISPPRINVCGKLKLICFDKTGTLTQDGLDFYGVLPAERATFKHLIQDPWKCSETSELLQAMATCHSLTRIDNVLTGDPLDLSMFEATKWELEEPGTETTRFDMLAPTVVKPVKAERTAKEEHEEADALYGVDYEIGIIRQFPFSSTQQCMSVICRTLGSVHMTAFTKGAPERICAMCVADSVPPDFAPVLAAYTTSGYRVLALAGKTLPRKLKWKDAQKTKREVIECDLQFLGFIIMQNALKPETTPIIHELHSAKIRTVMVTGDNVMTAISVSRDCGMVLPNETVALLKECSDTDDSHHHQPRITVEFLGSPSRRQAVRNGGGDCILNCESNSRMHVAMDGKTWSLLRSHYAELIPRIVLHGTIFARFRPEQKTQLVTSLQDLDYVVAMCGDGANDCGALKAAHIGVSLSQAEASVAAPFTSANQNIACVKHLVSEGRCALVTSFAVFKYMALYSLIQFFTVLILYKRYTTLGNMQFLYIDLIITTSLAVTMGYQGPAHNLVSIRPMGSLVSLVNLIPLLLQIVLCGAIQYGALYYLTLQPWFSPLMKDTYHGEEVIVCWENTIVFSVSCYQYVILACVYSKGRPYRQSVFTNGLLLFTVVLLTIFTTLLLVYPVEPLAELFEMIPLSRTHHQLVFRSQILLFPVLHFVLAVVIEIGIGQRSFMKIIAHCLTRKQSPKNKYKLIDQSVDIHNWLDVCPNNVQQHSIHC